MKKLNSLFTVDFLPSKFSTKNPITEEQAKNWDGNNLDSALLGKVTISFNEMPVVDYLRSYNTLANEDSDREFINGHFETHDEENIAKEMIGYINIWNDYIRDAINGKLNEDYAEFFIDANLLTSSWKEYFTYLHELTDVNHLMPDMKNTSYVAFLPIFNQLAKGNVLFN